jgi:hypothetical protein
MGAIPDSALGKSYEQHIDDALLISSFEKVPQYFRGRDGLREHLQGILGISGLQSEIAFWAETESPQTLMIVEQITMQLGGQPAHMRFADSWVLRDGRIATHFAGMVQYPDGSMA